MVRLVKNNAEDERLVADLERLAAPADDGDLVVDVAVDEASVVGASASAAGDSAGTAGSPRGGRLGMLGRMVRHGADDPRVVADLELLAGARAVDEGGTAAAAHVPDAERVRELAESGVPVEDAFVRRFVRASVHVRRYLPFYAGGLAWLAVMALVQPLGKHNTAEAQFAGATTQAAVAPISDAASAPSPDVIALPELTSDSVGASDLASSSLSFDDSAFSESPATTMAPTFDESTYAAPTFTDDATTVTARPLTIVQSGYSSRTGGTPLEQAPPQNGLPVAAAAGQPAKRSFIKLSGTELILKLKLVEDSSNVNNDQATIKACEITQADWAAQRGTSFDTEPKWDSAHCVDGARGDLGVWSFDFTSFGDPTKLAGLAITPGDGSVPFNVTFMPTTAL